MEKPLGTLPGAEGESWLPRFCQLVILLRSVIWELRKEGMAGQGLRPKDLATMPTGSDYGLQDLGGSGSGELVRFRDSNNCDA